MPRRLPFDPRTHDLAKLTVVYLHGAILLAPRRYTLTHSDTTGQLVLSLGRKVNQVQFSSVIPIAMLMCSPEAARLSGVAPLAPVHELS